MLVMTYYIYFMTCNVNKQKPKCGQADLKALFLINYKE